ncbi:MAG: sugar ABC transporter permease [Anaerolineae bacterium]|nr:sugar ABC transporter permease [Anaerolineae bacterium]
MTNPTVSERVSQNGLLNWYANLSLSRRRTILGYMFIMPFILGFILWFLAPALVAGYLSFQRWNLLSPPRFVGLDNFDRLINDPLFFKSLQATFIYTITSVPLGLIFAFFLATLINTKIRGISIFRTIYYLPTIVPFVASAILWAWILNTEFGLLNAAIRALGGPKIAWLQEPGWAMVSFVIMSAWAVGGPMIIFLAGLQGIPEVYYEAAEIDGAGNWAKLRFVTLPLMSPIIFFNFVIGIIGAAQEFVRAYLITGGGPENSTLFLVLYIYRTAFQSQRMGYAAVLSWVLFIILMVLSYFVFRYIGSQGYY